MRFGNFVSMNELVLISMPVRDLQGIIIECVNACLRTHTPAEPVNKSQSPELETTFDIAGLAKYLDCSLPTIHNLKKEGVLPFYRLGRKVYFKKSEVDGIARVAAAGEKKKGIKL